MKRIITLTTDFGYRDYYVGAVKGHLYSLMGGDAQIVDISHKITPFDLNHAAYVVLNCYNQFPDGTIHIIGVDTEKTPENRHIVVLFNNHYFILPDNGLISLIMGSRTQDGAVEIASEKKTAFATLDIFAVAAAHLVSGGSMLDLGTKVSEISQLKPIRPFVRGEGNSQLVGNVIHTDRYGNAITNITREMVEKVAEGRSCELMAGGRVFKKIYDGFSEMVDFSVDKEYRDYDGEFFALYNESRHLTIAVYRGNLETVGGASSLLGLEIYSQIMVSFR